MLYFSFLEIQNEIKNKKKEGFLLNDARELSFKLNFYNVANLIVSQVVVKGPAVANGEASLGFAGTFRNDSCLAYV